MSEYGWLWRIGFGAMMLAFCVVSAIVRKPAPLIPSAEVPVPVAAPLPAAPRPVEAASAAQPSSPAPLDIQEEAPPARVQVTFMDPPVERRSSKVKPAPAPLHHAAIASAPIQRPLRALPRARVHRVAAAKPVSTAVAKRRPHYPYDPHERWAWREQP